MPNLVPKSFAASPINFNPSPVIPVTAETALRFVSYSFPTVKAPINPVVSAPIAAVANPAGVAKPPICDAISPNIPPPSAAAACPSLNLFFNPSN